MNNNIHPLTDIFDAGLTTNYETVPHKNYGIHIDTVQKETLLSFEEFNETNSISNNKIQLKICVKNKSY